MARVIEGSAVSGVVRQRHKTAETANGTMGSSEGEAKNQETYRSLDSKRGEARGDPTGEKTVEGEEAMRKQQGASLVVVCFLGIFVSYFIYGLVQERM